MVQFLGSTSEDLVADSILALDRTAPAEAPLCDAFAALLRFHAQFDTSFTHFRFMDALLRRGYTVTVPVVHHPAYSAHQAWFDQVVQDRSFAFVASQLRGDAEDAEGEDDDERRDERGSEDGYLEDGTLYCDRDSRLWIALVASGALPGGEPLHPPRLAEVVAQVIAATDDPHLIKDWYRRGPNALFRDWFTEPVKAGESFALDPFTGEPVIAKHDLEHPRAFTLDELLAIPVALAIRDAGLAALVLVPDDEDLDEDIDDEENEDVEDPVDDRAVDRVFARLIGCPDDKEIIDKQRRAYFAETIAEVGRHPFFTEAHRVRAWWAAEPE